MNLQPLWFPEDEQDEPDFDQRDIDLTIAKLVSKTAYSPGELFDENVADRASEERKAQREAMLRHCLADALEHPTPANLESLGRAALYCCQAALDDEARFTLKEEM